MCDEATQADSDAYLEQMRLSRRELGVAAGAALTVAMTGCASAAPSP